MPPERRDPPRSGAARSAEALAQRAVRFMEAHRDRPFFAYLAPNAVHIPLTATPAVTIDLVPTLLEVAGAAVEPGSLDGESLLPILREPGRAGEWWSRMTIAPTEAPGTLHPGELDLR